MYMYIYPSSSSLSLSLSLSFILQTAPGCMQTVYVPLPDGLARDLPPTVHGPCGQPRPVQPVTQRHPCARALICPSALNCQPPLHPATVPRRPDLLLVDDDLLLHWPRCLPLSAVHAACQASSKCSSSRFGLVAAAGLVSLSFLIFLIHLTLQSSNRKKPCAK